MLARFVTSIIGVVLVVYGVIAAISPLPLGVPLIVLGIIMIAAANPAARPLVLKMRRKWPWFDFLVRKIGGGQHKHLKETIEATDPKTHPEEDEENEEDKQDA